MIHKVGFDDRAEARMSAIGAGLAAIGLKNRVTIRCFEYEGGPLLWEEINDNITVNEGLNDILSQYFKGSSYTASFFVGLVDNASFSAFAAGDTAAQIGGSNGWLESTAYTQSVRQTLTLGSVSAQSVDNSGSVASFTMNASGTLKGAFLDTNSTKAGTSGKLIAEVAFGGGNQPFVNGNVIQVTYTLTASSV